MRKVTLLICLLAVTVVAAAQEKPATPQDKAATPAAPSQPNPNPYSAFNKRAYAQMKVWLTASAEKMPEENYSFKPTEAVRSFGQIVGHVADAQYMFCSSALGEKNPGLKIEQTKTTKADLVSALKDAFAYCDKVYDGLTDANGVQTAKAFGQDMPKFNVLTVNNMHDIEHYGNMVVYLRLKGLVPPSTEAAQAQQQQQQSQPKK